MLGSLTNIYDQIVGHLNEPTKRDKLLNFFNYLIILFMTIAGVSALYLPKTEIIGFGVLTITFCGFILYVATQVDAIMKGGNWAYNTLFIFIFAGFSLVSAAITLIFLTFTSLRTKYYNKTGNDYVVTDKQRQNIDIFKNLFIAAFIIFTILIIVVIACKDIFKEIYPGFGNTDSIIYLGMYLLSVCGFTLAGILLTIAFDFQKSRRRIT